MEDAAERLIRRALGRHPAPRLSPAFTVDDLGRLAADERVGRPRAAARWTAAASWLAVGAASLVVVAHVESSSVSRGLAWGFALLLVPLAYAAALWPRPFLALLAPCGRAACDAAGEPGSSGGPIPRERG
jgi:hypothetical protein